MDEQRPHEQVTHALQSAAERSGWNECRDATEALLCRMPTSRAVLLSRDFVARRLSSFERQQPGVAWPRELLEAIEAESSSRRGKTWPEEDEYPGPGGNSFKKALESLWSASLRMEDARQCTAELVDAISRAIIAEYVEHWGSRHPKEWALWYELALSGKSDPRMTDIQLAMVRDPDVKKLVRAAWFEVADRLEAELREP
jgi:hypothetical protein